MARWIPLRWPETITLALEAIETVEFHTEEQKANIFYNDTARFLRLGQETIVKYHA